ncbi:zinc-dependent alcohol dehydrogenase [Paracoccus pacificus]|uniref:Zinc-binding dehydrogenase n=1 Tax=Paracoccus pacificus TaxID=1463598 RepID=A0ABW4R8B5_9RHOB
MRAVRLHGVGDLRAEEIAEPARPGTGEVTLRLTAAGICGSDLHNFRTGAWITRAPSVAGHEFTGVVSAIGTGVDDLGLGDRIIVDSRYLCGACPACLSGRGQVCARLGFLGEVIDGGFAEAVTLPARNVIAAPAGVLDRHLAMAEPLAVALHALRRLAAPDGAGIAVIGCGPIGGLVALLARRMGHEVRVFDRNARRASIVANATGARVGTAEHLPGCSDDGAAIRHVVETTGSDQVIRSLIATLPGCGTIALVGIRRTAPVIDPGVLVEREISVLGCHAFADRDLHDVAGMLPALSPALDPFIAEQIPLAEVPAAYARHIAGLKTIIFCGAGQNGG